MATSRNANICKPLPQKGARSVVKHNNGIYLIKSHANNLLENVQMMRKSNQVDRVQIGEFGRDILGVSGESKLLDESSIGTHFGGLGDDEVYGGDGNDPQVGDSDWDFTYSHRNVPSH
jgi:hypothetical protein